MARRTETLFRKLTILLFLVLATLTFVQIGLMFWMFLRVSDESEQRLMLSSSSELAELIQPYVRTFPEYEELERLAHAFTTANPRLTIFLLAGDGSVQARFGRFGPGKAATNIPPQMLEDLLRRFSEKAFPQYGPDPQNGNRTVIYSLVPMTVLGKAGFLYLVLNNELAADIYGMSAENISLTTTVVFFFVASLLAGLLGYFLLRYLRGRLNRVVSVVEQLADSDLSVRVGEQKSDEIGALGRSVDIMADRLEESIGLLAERDNLRRQLIADVSHDLRGPVSSMKGFLEILSGMKRDTLQEKFPQILPSLSASADALERLLSELFELARIEAKERAPERIVFELDTLVEEVVSTLGGLAAKKGIALDCVAGEGRFLVRGDANMLSRAIQNLVGNAISYSPEGSTVRVALVKDSAEVEVRIEDQGDGVAAKDSARIFDRFEQGDKGITQVRQAGGLGLAIVQHVLRLHGTTAELVTHSGKGAIFSFRLPVVEGGN